MRRRSGEAVSAMSRKAGPMRHRLAERGGATNEQANLLEEALDEHGFIQPYEDSDDLLEPEAWCIRCHSPKNRGPSEALCACGDL